ncbi:hypothetical protein ACJIZ3_003238 [Penstemon smallii]|uniref:KIB1-4 beta-propeller domain-containing protein n=1 Tax=Penstemon smallii TaxID=265156 RepID=A0ABD3UA41_9LAMI
MSRKANKEKSWSKKKEAISKKPCPNLPQQLLNLLARKPNLLEQTSYSGITKSWQPATKRCNTSAKVLQRPQLYDLHDSNFSSISSNTLQKYMDIYFFKDSSLYFRGEPPTRFWCDPTIKFVGCSHGSPVMSRGSTNQKRYSIWNVARGHEWVLPPWISASIPFKFATLSHSFMEYGGNSTVLVLTGISSPVFLLYSSFRVQWIPHDCTTIDPYGSKNDQFMTFSNVIGFGGKFYALSLQGTFVFIEDTINSHCEMTVISTNRAVPSVSSKYFKEFLLESNGEVLLVFLIYIKSLSVVDQVEVFRFSFPKHRWIKVEGIEGRAVFLEKQCCVWVNSKEIGCMGDCVYFNQGSENGWWMYDMGNGCISPSRNLWDECMIDEAFSAYRAHVKSVIARDRHGRRFLVRQASLRSTEYWLVNWVGSYEMTSLKKTCDP